MLLETLHNDSSIKLGNLKKKRQILRGGVRLKFFEKSVRSFEFESALENHLPVVGILCWLLFVLFSNY